MLLVCHNCGESFKEKGYHRWCPKCRKLLQREKERIAKREPEDENQILLKWFLPQ